MDEFPSIWQIGIKTKLSLDETVGMGVLSSLLNTINTYRQLKRISSLNMELNKKFVCICDRNKPELASIITSYLNENGTYLPVFEFPFVSTAWKNTDMNKMDEDSMSINGAEETVITINNAIARMGGCDLLVFAGLSEEQKSYLGMWENQNQISIDKFDEVNFHLGHYTDKKDRLLCRSSEVMIGLYTALRNGLLLGIDEDAEEIVCELYQNSQLVIAEDDHSVAGLSAALYAHASGSEI